jgi:hypothetical protein
MRHPNIAGGLYFSVNAILSQVLLWSAITMYSTYLSNAGDNSDMRPFVQSAALLSSIWVLSVLGIARSSQKGYSKTFVSLTTNRQFMKETWDWWMAHERSSMPSDEIISNIFVIWHEDFYRDFEDEVRAWVESKWEKWQLEKPKFFNKKFIESIPLSVLSKEIREMVMIDDANANNSGAVSSEE